jgi:hypothetical protein
MARSWCKVSASLDSHPRIRRAGNLGRQVFEFALRRNAEVDQNGVISADHFDPDYLADVLMLTTEQAAEGVSRCVRTGLLVQDGHDFVIRGWDDDWGKRPMTEAERKRNQRARSREDSSSSSMSRKCPDVDVTKRDCPDSHTGEERRGEEIRERAVAENPAPSLTLVPDTVPTPKATRPRKAAVQLPEDWKPSESAATRAAELDASRRGVSVELELAKLADWARAKGETCKDWEARWRNWLRSARPPTSGQNGSWSQNNNVTTGKKTNIL